MSFRTPTEFEYQRAETWSSLAVLIIVVKKIISPNSWGAVHNNVDFTYQSIRALVDQSKQKDRKYLLTPYLSSG